MKFLEAREITQFCWDFGIKKVAVWKSNKEK
jgi:hypothetical protein